MKTFIAHVHWTGGAAKVSVQAQDIEQARELALKAFSSKAGATVRTIFEASF